ncbi:oxidoreductase [Brevundimonas sp. LM2]|uniref:SDR family NAD(P)-dependent oxidoreductase n=1 Tax=Brevundimonas sp. LM2 TaxID=1938605 RepID=UPI00098403DD|nr:SDR family NAD(P)-dependent oxidoreductase [Brevundimonas sp. LM2]AQR62477.1 oxidoreductase [Brevundimonas sp. LM2]
MSDTDFPTAAETARPLAVVTGASTGIGYELARLFADDGFDLIVAADTSLAEAQQTFEGLGARVETLQADLSTEDGVQSLYDLIGGRPVDALAANAGHGLGEGFLDQDFADIRHVIDTNITGTTQLLHLVGRDMRERGRGQILLTGSIAGLMPGTFQAVYNASKAYVDSFSFALRNELKDTGVSVTVLMPGPTETEFFERAGMEDTAVGQGKKMEASKVAEIGYAAMKRGDGDVVAGLMNKLQAATAAVTPQTVLAEMHRKQAEPGSGT